jgi:hypothetical protein
LVGFDDISEEDLMGGEILEDVQFREILVKWGEFVLTGLGLTVFRVLLGFLHDGCVDVVICSGLYLYVFYYYYIRESSICYICDFRKESNNNITNILKF